LTLFLGVAYDGICNGSAKPICDDDCDKVHFILGRRAFLVNPPANFSIDKACQDKPIRDRIRYKSEGVIRDGIALFVPCCAPGSTKHLPVQ